MTLEHKIYRYLNRDGTLNVTRTRYSPRRLDDVYHSLLVASWKNFLSIVGGLYFLINLLFGFGYYLCGKEGLAGLGDVTGWSYFLTCFFFSVQTLATIGYGHISPAGLIANLLVTIEALVGLLGLALATGLIFARFSKPTSRVVFSNSALICPIDGVPSLIFRMANRRSNQIVEARITVTLLRDEETKEGEQFRNLYPLTLERDFSPLFSLAWTVVHPLDEKSPFLNKKKEDLIKENAEILVTLIGIDETFSQPVNSRFSYSPEDLVWNARFKNMLSRTSMGTIQLNLQKIHDYELIDNTR